MRVIAPDVGGGFGAKVGVYPEELLLALARPQVGRPVRWTETRTENMIDARPRPGPGPARRASAAPATAQSPPTGSTVVQDGGAYPRIGGVPAVHDPHDGHAASTTSRRSSSTPRRSSPTRRRRVAYRGAGRPEAAAAIERAVDLFAAEIGMDPAEVRRRNLVADGRLPVHDAGRHRPTTSATTSGPSTWRSRPPATTSCGPSRPRAASAGDPTQLGIGLAVYVEITAGAGGGEYGAVEVLADGTVDRPQPARRPHGQGHEHGVGDARQRPPRHPDGATSRSSTATPTSCRRAAAPAGSRSLQLGGSAVVDAADQLVDAGPRSSRPTCSRPPRRRRARHGRRPASTWPGTPAVGRRGRERRPPPPASDGLVGRGRLRGRRGRRSRSAPTSPSSRSTPRPARSS